MNEVRYREQGRNIVNGVAAASDTALWSLIARNRVSIPSVIPA